MKCYNKENLGSKKTLNGKNRKLKTEEIQDIFIGENIIIEKNVLSKVILPCAAKSDRGDKEGDYIEATELQTKRMTKSKMGRSGVD